jgi:hypothetical protein
MPGTAQSWIRLFPTKSSRQYPMHTANYKHANQSFKSFMFRTPVLGPKDRRILLGRGGCGAWRKRRIVCPPSVRVGSAEHLHRQRGENLHLSRGALPIPRAFCWISKVSLLRPAKTRVLFHRTGAGCIERK